MKITLVYLPLKFNPLFSNVICAMKHLFLLSVLIFIGCKSEPKVEEINSEDQEKAYTLSAEDIEKLDYTDYVLSPDSEQALLDWQKYQELQVSIELLKKANLSFLR